MNKNENVVVAVYEDKASAEAAIDGLRRWDKASDDIKLGAIGLLYKEGDQVKASIGRRTGSGAKVGAIVGVITGVLTGGVGLIPGAAAGGLLGGALGAFFRQSLNLNEAECAALGMELDLGKAAVVVTVDEYEMNPTRLQLEHAGGNCKAYVVPKAALDEAAAAYAARREAEVRLADREIGDALTQSGLDIPGQW